MKNNKESKGKRKGGGKGKEMNKIKGKEKKKKVSKFLETACLRGRSGGEEGWEM